MKKTISLLLLLFVCSISWAQQPISSEEAISIIAKLEENPAYIGATDDMELLIEWMTSTEDAYVYINQKEVNKILKQDFTYKKEMYVLLLAGMAKYDLNHPDADLQQVDVDKTDGYMCMCKGYRNILTLKGLENVKYYDKLCKKYCGF